VYYVYKYVLVRNILHQSIVNYSLTYLKFSSLKFPVKGNCGEVIVGLEKETDSLVSFSINEQTTNIQD
jgi:hypothetical protein